MVKKMKEDIESLDHRVRLICMAGCALVIISINLSIAIGISRIIPFVGLLTFIMFVLMLTMQRSELEKKFGGV
jgi:ABC-type transport system involved in cytochrome bd biosynthesis fused ATPase/permease subunit